MKLRVIAFMVFIALTVLSCTQSSSPSPSEPEAPTNKLIGVWKNAGLVDTDLDIPEGAREMVADYYMVFTKKYRFVVGSRIPCRQELPENPTDSQLLAAWEPVVAMIFTYEVKENNIITRLVFAKNPMDTPGGEHSYPLKFDGDDLIWTYGVNEGRNIVTQRYTRLE